MTKTELENRTDLLLEIAEMLLGSGADTNSVQIYLDRFANAVGCNLEMSATHWAVMLTIVSKEDSQATYSKVKKIKSHGTNFNIISEFSIKSREIEKCGICYNDLREFTTNLKEKKHNYHIVSILLLVGFASAGFAYLFGGDFYNMLVTFVASAVGQQVKFLAHKKGINPYFCVGYAAFTSCIIAMFGMLYNIGARPDLAVATCVLYLIPGSVFVASFTDFIEGRVVNGLVRLTHALIMAFAIAAAMFLAMYIFQLKIF